MPQLDINTYFSQIFWLLITFGIFYMFLNSVIIPKIKVIIENRNNKIEEFIDHAKNLRKSAENIKLEYEDVLKKSKIDADYILTEAKQQIEEQNNAKNDELQRKFTQDMKKLDQELAQKTKELKATIKESSAKYTALILNKLTNVEFDKNLINNKINEHFNKD